MTYQPQKDAIADKFVGAVSDAADRAGDLADRLQKQGANAQDMLANKAAELSGQVSATLKKVGVDTDDVKGAMGDALDQLGSNLRQIVKNRPIGALALAAGIGLLFGIMSAR